MEKHSFGFSGKIRKERAEYEAKIGIKDEQSEVPVNLFFVSLSLFTVCLIMGAFLFILRKKTGGIIFTCLASVFAFSSVFMGDIIPNNREKCRFVIVAERRII